MRIRTLSLVTLTLLPPALPLLAAAPVATSATKSAAERAPAAAAAIPATADALFARLFSADIARQLARLTERHESDFKVQVENLTVTPEIPEDISSSRVFVLGLGGAGARRLDGLFALTVVSERGETVKEFRVSGAIKVIGPVVVARNNLVRGTRINESDLVWKTMAWSQLPTGAVGVSLKALTGQKVKTLIQSGEPVWFGSLEEPMAVSTGEVVEITVFSGPGVIIRSRGIARQTGRIGDLIRVEQPDTKKMLSGLVSGSKAVEVRL